VRVLRCLIPRTFVDVNRILDAPRADYAKTGITAAIPDYVRDPEDVATLRSLHATYQEVAERAYDEVCGRGGLALMLHSYAPRSVDVGAVDERIVPALRAAYEPGTYERWPERPEVEIIDRAPDGTCLSDAALVTAVEAAYAALGIVVARNQTYRLDPSTTGHRHAVRHKRRVLCVELNRARLADPFDPFVEMRVPAARAEALVAPLAHALARCLTDPHGD
jgi:N-formylglutamate amidohydrolase